MEKITIKLRRGIPKGTVVKDLYDDGTFFYKIGKIWYPVDFNGFRHPDFCDVEVIK